VEQATGREAVAPWRISATVRDAVAGNTWTRESLTVASSCTGCGACTDACLPGVTLPAVSRAARAHAARSGELLPAAVAMAARLDSTGLPRRDRDAVPALPADGRVAVLFGCTVQAHRPRVGTALRSLLNAAGEPARGCGTPESCCGAAALDLGLTDQALRLANELAERLAGADEVVAVSPGCVRMIRDEWPRLGVVAPPVRTAVEWLAGALAMGRLPVPAAAGDQGDAVGWHDPCTLARVLDVTDAPRQVLAALGLEVRMPPESGRETTCSGAGAAYDLVDAPGAAAVGRARAGQLAALTAPVVSACPQAERWLEPLLGAPVRDLLEVAADAIATRV
jgi:Fe-S oxidoreductase